MSLKAPTSPLPSSFPSLTLPPQDDEQYEKLPKRPKLDPLATPPMPDYSAYAKAINYAKAKGSLQWPWPPKPFPPMAYPPPSLPSPGEFRRPEELQPSPQPREERYSESPVITKPKYEKDGEVRSYPRQPALADEIATVADALQDAPKHATETVLKILERLTQRLDKAERDRDLCLGKYKELQSRYAQLEEELAKKRGELRMLLQQDSRIPPLEEVSKSSDTVTNGNTKEEKEDSSPLPASEPHANLTVIVARLGEGREEPCPAGSRLTDHLTPGTGLPRLEVKSPSRLLEPEVAVSPPRGREEVGPAKEESREQEEREIAVREEFLSKFQKNLINHKSKVQFFLPPLAVAQHRVLTLCLTFDIVITFAASPRSLTDQ